MTVEAGLAHEDLHPPAQALGYPFDAIAQSAQGVVGGRRGGVAHARGPAVVAEDRAPARPPIRRWWRRLGPPPACGGIRFASGSAAALSSSASARSTAAASRAERQRSTASMAERSTVSSTRMIPPSSPSCSGEGYGLGVDVLAHHLQLAGLDTPHALAVRLDHLGLHVGHGLDRSAALGHGGHLIARAGHERVHQRVHHLRPLEDVGVFEQVGLVGERSAECATTTAGPTGAASREPRSRPGAAGPSPARNDPPSRQAPPARCG